MTTKCPCPTPGPGHWDYKCLRCDSPIQDHKLRHRIIFPFLIGALMLASLVACVWLLMSVNSTAVAP